MKNFFKIVAGFKTLWALFFTGEIIVYMFFAYLNGNTSMSYTLILQLLAIAAVVAAFQLILDCEPAFLKRIPCILKSIIHYILMAVILIAICLLFGWLTNATGVFSFMVIYTAIFIVFSLVFTLYFKVTGEKFNDKLHSYKSKTQNSIK